MHGLDFQLSVLRDNRLRWDITGDDASCPHNAAVTDSGALENNNIGTNPTTRSNFHIAGSVFRQHTINRIELMIVVKDFHIWTKSAAGTYSHAFFAAIIAPSLK